MHAHTSPDVISLFTARGEVLCAWSFSASLFGYRPEEVTGRSALEFIHSDDHDRSRDALHTVLAAPGIHRRIHVRVRRRDGEWRHVEITIANFLKAPRIRAIMATCRQAAPVGDAAEAVQPAPERQSGACELELFAHAVAHDLREPLRTLSMFTQVLVLRTELDAEQKELAST